MIWTPFITNGVILVLTTHHVEVWCSRVGIREIFVQNVEWNSSDLRGFIRAQTIAYEDFI